MALKSVFLFASTISLYGSVSALQNRTISWTPCPQNSTEPVSCATLTVPRAYSDLASNATIDLSLVKISAVKKPFKGSILFNPGGPGDDGTDWINGFYGESLLVATGGHHDLIGFDTRGTGDTLPFSCYLNDSDRTQALLKIPSTTNISDVAIGTSWAVHQTLAENCYDNAREVGELIGTAFVARDMMQIVDALQEDGLLRYWGFSYGTLLGMTVAAMFPDRMDKVILDGVVNPHQYYEGRQIEEVTDSDATFAGFFSGCLAAPPGNCALASPNITASGLEQQIIDYLDQVKYNPLALGPAEATSIIDYGTVKNAIVASLYSPTLAWPLLAISLQGLLQGNATAFLAYNTQIQSSAPLTLTEVGAGIQCGENSLRANSLAGVCPIIDTLYAKSFIAGGIEATIPLRCASWRIEAKEIYKGGFHNIQTKNPLLFIGNTFDPVTPLVSAKNASAAFVGSSVLQHDGYGHASLGQPSLCTAKAVRAYFVNGTLPENGAKCEPSIPLFSNETFMQAFAPIANFSRRGLDFNEDAALLTAVKTLGHSKARRQLLK